MMDKLSRLVGIAVCVTALAAAACCVEQRLITSSTGSPMTASIASFSQQRLDTRRRRDLSRAPLHGDPLLGPPRREAEHPTGLRQRPRARRSEDVSDSSGGFAANGDPNKMEKPLLNYHAKNIGATAYDNIYTQYYQINGRPVQTFITNPRNQGSKTTFWADNTNAIL